MGLPVLRLIPSFVHAAANTPARPMELIARTSSIDVGLPRRVGGSALALSVSRPARRLLRLQPVRSQSRWYDPLHRRLQRLRYLHRCFDCYRVERSSSRTGFAPVVDQRLFTTHHSILTRRMVHLGFCSARSGFRAGKSDCIGRLLPKPVGSPAFPGCAGTPTTSLWGIYCNGRDAIPKKSPR